MTKGQQARYINNVFRPYDELNTAVNHMIKYVKICPECFKQDKVTYGTAYLHRMHQLSGVKICIIHKVKLVEYTNRVIGSTENFLMFAGRLVLMHQKLLYINMPGMQTVF